MGKTGKKDGFILQAGILAAAGIICRIIGLLYRSPLTAVIGDRGNGYYQSAYNIYTIILLISSYSIPSAVSKVIAQKLSLGEYRNAHRVFLCAMWYVLAVGGMAGLFLFFGAGIFLEGPAVQVLKVFAPTIFLYGILGVLRGYFQAHRTMVQTSMSQILEQIMNAAISIGAAFFLIMMTLGSANYYTIGENNEVLFGKEVVAETALQEVGEEGEILYVLTPEQEEWNTTHAVYGAVGSAMGTGAGVVTALLFMWAVYGLNRKLIHKRIGRDRGEYVESYREIFGTVTRVVLPFVLSTAIYNLSTALNQTIYTKISSEVLHLEEKEVFTRYGIFSGKALVIRNIPIALASAMSSAILPSVSTAWAKEAYQEAREKVAKAVKVTMLISIPAGVGIGVLAKPVVQLLFPQRDSMDMAAGLLQVLAVTVVFYGLSTITNSVLQGIGKVNIPVRNAAISLVPQTVILVVCLLTSSLDLYSLALVEIIYAVMMSVLNQASLRKYMGYRQELFRSFITPFVAALFMGAVALGVYHGSYALISSNVLSLALSVVVAAVFYFILVIALGGITKEELESMPKGYLLVKVARTCHLM